jgi:hypothetical protein
MKEGAKKKRRESMKNKVVERQQQEGTLRRVARRQPQKGGRSRSGPSISQQKRFWS